MHYGGETGTWRSERSVDEYSGEMYLLQKSAADSDEPVEEKGCYNASEIHICSHKIGQPTVFIPVFPGTNCEYDSHGHLRRAGRKVITKYLRIWTRKDIRDSVEEFEKPSQGTDDHVPGRLQRRRRAGWFC